MSYNPSPGQFVHTLQRTASIQSILTAVAVRRRPPFRIQLISPDSPAVQHLLQHETQESRNAIHEPSVIHRERRWNQGDYSRREEVPHLINVERPKLDASSAPYLTRQASSPSLYTENPIFVLDEQ